MLLVLWPEIDIATRSEIPSRTISRTALRRRSWKMSPEYFSCLRFQTRHWLSFFHRTLSCLETELGRFPAFSLRH